LPFVFNSRIKVITLLIYLDDKSNFV
jgi:hypothetical protein